MNKSSLYFLFLFIAFVLLQGLILNKILLFGFINPYLYIAFMFLYPVTKNRFKTLTVAFLLGLSIDFFSNSGGIHAFATTFITFIRSYLFTRIFQKDETSYQLFKLNQEPFGAIFNYTAILVVTHHLLIFLLANFSFNNIIDVFLNTIFSSIFTILLFLTGNYIFSSKNQ